jgi:Immunity protein Imm1
MGQIGETVLEKDIYFDKYKGSAWPNLVDLEPYFLAPKGKEWFYSGGNDGAVLQVFGVDGTDKLEEGKGRIDVRLFLTGNPDHGVMLDYHKAGGEKREDYSSKGDLTRLKEWVRTLHDDPIPVGLFIPFPEAWKAVKEFIETEGALPKSIEWINNNDLPENTFPPPWFDENA